MEGKIGVVIKIFLFGVLLCDIINHKSIMSDGKNKKTGLGGFEPPTSGLEARRYVQAKPQAPLVPDNYVL